MAETRPFAVLFDRYQASVARFGRSTDRLAHAEELDGLVADVNGASLVLNVGSRSGIHVGDKLQVTRVGREIKDPATGKVLRRTESPMGTITISEVDDASAVGNYDGTAGVKVGDRVKR